MTKLSRTIALALSGAGILAAAPAAAATYVFSDSYDAQSGKGSLRGHFALSDIESTLAGYFEVNSLTVEELSFSGFVSVFDYSTLTFVGRPYSVSLSDTTFLTDSKEDVSLYNPSTMDFILKGDWGTESTTYFRSVVGEHLIVASNLISGDESFGVYAGGQRGHFGTENMTVTPLAAVPEPTTWAMMIGGLGLVGGAMRRRQRIAVRFA